MQEGHTAQDLLGQPDHVFLCKGLVVIRDALVEDFPPGGTVETEGVRKVRTGTVIKSLMWPRFSIDCFDYTQKLFGPFNCALPFKIDSWWTAVCSSHTVEGNKP